MAKVATKPHAASAAPDYAILLEQKSRDLRASLSAHSAAQVVARLDCPSDEGDLSQQSNEEWIFLNRNRLEATLLREVEDAIRRLPTDEYGICQECSEPISPKRLNAVPWAKYCIRCQDLVAQQAARGRESEAEE